MKKIRLTAREKIYFQQINEEAMDLRMNWKRRLRNAVLCLAQGDPRWMVWIEREIDTEIMSVQEMTRLIEARARMIVLKPHSFFGRKIIGDMIFRDDWAFTDRGNLGPG